jgi:hypothetical protein
VATDVSNAMVRKDKIDKSRLKFAIGFVLMTSRLPKWGKMYLILENLSLYTHELNYVDEMNRLQVALESFKASI